LLADEAIAALGRDPVLQLGAFAHALERETRIDLVVKIVGERPFLGRKEEETGPVELGLRQERKQLVMVGLGFARIPEDERGPERRHVVEPADADVYKRQGWEINRSSTLTPIALA